MAIARFLDCMGLALRASGLWLCYANLQSLIPSFPWIASRALHPGAIQGKEGIKFCYLATLVAGGGRRGSGLDSGPRSRTESEYDTGSESGYGSRSESYIYRHRHRGTPALRCGAHPRFRVRTVLLRWRRPLRHYHHIA